MNAYNKRMAAAGKKRRAQIRALRRMGFSVSTIAIGRGISRARVYQLLAKKP